MRLSKGCNGARQHPELFHARANTRFGNVRISTQGDSVRVYALRVGLAFVKELERNREGRMPALSPIADNRAKKGSLIAWPPGAGAIAMRGSEETNGSAGPNS